jgi:hypothetical protein
MTDDILLLLHPQASTRFSFHRLSRPLIPEHQDLRHDADRDLFGRFGVQLQPDRRMDPRSSLRNAHPSTP